MRDSRACRHASDDLLSGAELNLSWSCADNHAASQSRRCCAITSGRARTKHRQRQARIRTKAALTRKRSHCPDLRNCLLWTCYSRGHRGHQRSARPMPSAVGIVLPLVAGTAAEGGPGPAQLVEGPRGSPRSPRSIQRQMTGGATPIAAAAARMVRAASASGPVALGG